MCNTRADDNDKRAILRLLKAEAKAAKAAINVRRRIVGQLVPVSNKVSVLTKMFPARVVPTRSRGCACAPAQRELRPRLDAAFDYCRRPPVVLRSEGAGLDVMRDVEACHTVTKTAMDIDEWNRLTDCGSLIMHDWY